MAIAVAYDVRVSSSASAVKSAKAIVRGTGVIAAVGDSIWRALALAGALLLVRITEVNRQPNSTDTGKTQRRLSVEGSGGV
jgi:hypothetical protein